MQSKGFRFFGLVFILLPALALATFQVARTPSLQARSAKPGSVILEHGLETDLSLYQTGWARTFNTFFPGYRWEDGYSQSDSCAGVQPTEDGGVVLAGTVSLSGPGIGQQDLVVMKFEPSGQIDWKIRYDSDPNRKFRNNSASALLCVRSGYLVLGVSENTSVLAMKIDRGGDVHWLKSYSFSSQAIELHITAAAATYDGGCLVAGFSIGGDNWILKLDPLGNVMWNRHFNLPPVSLQPTADAGFIMASFADNRAQVLKFDIFGDLQWNRSYAADTDWDCDDIISYGNSISPRRDGGYVLAGETFGCTCCNHGYSAHWVSELDQSGRVVASKEYNLSWPTIFQTRDSSLLLIDSTGLMKLDASGAVQWKKYYNGTLPGPVSQNYAQGYLVGGMHYPEGGMIVLCLDRYGDMSISCQLAVNSEGSTREASVNDLASSLAEFHEDYVQVVPLAYTPHDWTFNTEMICPPATSGF